MRLSSIMRFPVKSLGGHALPAAVVDPRGVAGDRRWMVIDAHDRFVTRRDRPAMALLDVDATPTGLTITGPSGQCRITTPGDDAPVVDATVWRDTLAVRLGNDAADRFLSDALGQPVRLAYQHDASRRPVDARFSQPGDHVSLADAFPVLVTTTASLDALNRRLARPVTMERFRANLVIDGAGPWAEDGWRRIRIGPVELQMARPCARCIVVTQQPRTGERLDGNEPLAMLRAMGRLVGGGITFGQNAIPHRPGTLNVGDTVEVLERERDPPPA